MDIPKTLPYLATGSGLIHFFCLPCGVPAPLHLLGCRLQSLRVRWHHRSAKPGLETQRTATVVTSSPRTFPPKQVYHCRRRNLQPFPSPCLSPWPALAAASRPPARRSPAAGAPPPVVLLPSLPAPSSSSSRQSPRPAALPWDCRFSPPPP